jgi:threonine 3-dehydrogenase
MLALQKIEPGPGLTLHHVPRPKPACGEVLVRVRAVGICGSDLHLQRWTRGYEFVASALPVTIGHEFAGNVAEIGSEVVGLEIGQRVAVMPSVTCGQCEACREALLDQCLTRTSVGFTRSGAFAEFVAVPAINCMPIAKLLGYDLAALAEPLTVSMQAVIAGGVRHGSRVLVMGPGTIGQGIALAARRSGAALVVVVGKGDSHRLSVLRSMGFRSLLDIEDADATVQLRQLSMEGFDIVFEATGWAPSVDQGLRHLKSGGTMVLTGIYGARSELDATDIVRRSLQVRGSYRAPRAVWPHVLATLASSPEEFAPMISHRLPLKRVLEGFSLSHSRQGSKVMIVSNSNSQDT